MKIIAPEFSENKKMNKYIIDSVVFSNKFNKIHNSMVPRSGGFGGAVGGGAGADNLSSK